MTLRQEHLQTPSRELAIAAFEVELSRRFSDFQRHGTSCCVMLLDLDHFKSINDRCGHDGGDVVLQSVSQVLRDALRETDLAARYGGEEFGIILPATPLPDACTTAERIRQAITASGWKRQDPTLLITASSGLAAVRPGDDELTLVRRADESLYFAKKQRA